ncbi:MAG TPA: LamG domain-containing protein [Paraburkholderia sp.]|jgi:hypothetical protein|nr:LamG domain-containing protein [Paraburkholderia sp.]
MRSSIEKSGTAVSHNQLSGDFTLASWVDISRTPGNADELFFGSGGMDINFYQQRPRFYSGTQDSAVSNRPVTANTWTHVAVTRRAGALTVYVDGQATGSGTWADAFDLYSTGESSRGTLQGTLSNVLVQDTALTAGQISTLVDQTAGAPHVPWLR